MRLTKRQQRFIVERFACGDSGSLIMREFTEEFGFEISRQLVHTYNLDREANRARASQDLLELFESVREKLRARHGDIAIANKGVRLHRLERLYQAAEERDDIDRAAALLEQAAKECGGAFTNKHQIEHDFTRLSDAELIARAAGAFAGALPAGADITG